LRSEAAACVWPREAINEFDHAIEVSEVDQAVDITGPDSDAAWRTHVEPPPDFAAQLQGACVCSTRQRQVGAIEVERVELAGIERDLVAACKHAPGSIQDRDREQHFEPSVIFARRWRRQRIDHADAQRLPGGQRHDRVGDVLHKYMAHRAAPLRLGSDSQQGDHPDQHHDRAATSDQRPFRSLDKLHTAVVYPPCVATRPKRSCACQVTGLYL
jgi:hypothetical protein